MVGQHDHQNVSRSVDSHALKERLHVEAMRDIPDRYDDDVLRSPSHDREEAHRLADEIAMQKAERLVTSASELEGRTSTTLQRSRSRAPEPIDDFDAATNPSTNAQLDTSPRSIPPQKSQSSSNMSMNPVGSFVISLISSPSPSSSSHLSSLVH